ncbi:HIT family protein [Kitasatospora sp. HPMI-4]|uniref:HIT family protein n=1 Tax=Kitasatospora sp. HPMI-4 TaxID=3448443 RepID=UPI003F1DA752
MTSKRIPFDEAAYSHRSRTGPCFICRMLAGAPGYRHETVYEDDRHVAFLDKHPTLLGKLLVAPKLHIEDPVGGFTETAYLALQAVVHKVATGLRQVVPTERIYVYSLGSNQGNAHVHWHVAALPPGVPYERQQTNALLWETAGLLDVDEETTAALAEQLRAAISGG